MQKFLVLYLAPPSVLEDWAKTDPDVRKSAEEKMHGEWQAWMKGHDKHLADEGAGAGRTKRITREGVSDTKNNVMLYSIVEAESHEAAAKLFENHPHLQIPQSSIEVMVINPLQRM
jgi:hypothetical protein